MTLHSCEWHAAPARIYGPLNPTKFRLINHADFPVILSLVGPENYLVIEGQTRYIYSLLLIITTTSGCLAVNRFDRIPPYGVTVT